MKMKKFLLMTLLAVTGGAGVAWADSDIEFNLKPSKDLALRKGNAKQSGTGTTIEIRENNNEEALGYHFCGVMEFDLTDVKTKLDAGYTIEEAKLMLTDCSNNMASNLVIKSFPTGWTEDKTTTYDTYQTVIEAAVSASALATLQLQRYGGKKAFELQNANTHVNPFPLSSYQNYSVNNDPLKTYITSTLTNQTAVGLLIARDLASSNNCGFYTKDFVLNSGDTKNCAQYAWNNETSKWEKVENTDNTISRAEAALQFFGMTEAEFKEAVAPRLYVRLAPPAMVRIIPGINADVMTINNTMPHSNTFNTRDFVDKDGNTIASGAFSATQNWEWLYLGRFNTSTIAAIKLNVAMGQISSDDSGARVSNISIGGHVTTQSADTITNGNSGDIKNVVRINGTQTVNGANLHGLIKVNTWAKGADYLVDFVNDQITVDEEAFQIYWKDKGAAYATLTSYNSGRNTSATSQFGELASTFKTSECMDIFLYSDAAQWGRIGCSAVTIFYKDGSSTSLPVTSLSAGGVTTAVSGNYTAQMIQDAYLNTEPSTTVSAATLGDVTLTTDNISAFTALKSANIDVTASSASYDLTVNRYKASTLMLPFNAALPDGVSAWTLNYTSGDKVTATTASSITANTPVLINANAGTYTFTATDATIDPVSQASGALTGVYATTNVPTSSYILWANNENHIGFYKANSSTVAPYRAYLTAEGAGTKLMIDFDGMATGLESLTPNPSPVGEGSIFNLAGQRMSRLQKGVNIVNGKKVLVK